MEPCVHELKKSVHCLALELCESIYQDVAQKAQVVFNYVEELELKCKMLEGQADR